MEQEAHSVVFEPSGRGKAQCPPDPLYPSGKATDCTVFGETTYCTKELPYPAPECGAWMVRCAACGMSVALRDSAAKTEQKGE